MSAVLRSWIGAAVFLLLQLAASTAFATYHCGAWINQYNGTSWCQCMDNELRHTCWLIKNQPGSIAWQVKC